MAGKDLLDPWITARQKKLIRSRPLKSKSQAQMSSPIVQPSSFNVSKVSISQPRIMDSGGKMAYLNYGDARSLVVQTPSLPSPFGLSVFDKTGPPKYSIDLAMRGYQENPKVKSFYEALNSLDEYMIEQGVKNSKLWFKIFRAVFGRVGIGRIGQLTAKIHRVDPSRGKHAAGNRRLFIARQSTDRDRRRGWRLGDYSIGKQPHDRGQYRYGN